jgi:hypothetical protein
MNKGWFVIALTTHSQLGKCYETSTVCSRHARSGSSWDNLQELAIDIEANSRQPAYTSTAIPHSSTKINPPGKLPVHVDGEMVLTESIAIDHYLAEIPATRR